MTHSVYIHWWLIVYIYTDDSVTRLLTWDFTVKLGTTTIHGKVQLIRSHLQLDNGSENNHTIPQLDCLRRWLSDHTFHHPNILNELAAKSEKWNRKPRLACVIVGHPLSKHPEDVLPLTFSLWAKHPSKVTWFSEDLKCWGAWEHHLWAQNQGHHTVDRLEEVERGSARRSSLKGREKAIVS